MSALAYATFVAALWVVPDAGSGGAASEPRFAVKQTRIAAQPAAQPGHRFGMSGTLQVRTATPASGPFGVKGVIQPGECVTLFFRDGFEN